MGPTSRSLPIGTLAVLAAIIGPLGARLGLLPPIIGFAIFIGAGALGLVSVIWGVVSKVRGPARGGALGALIGAVPMLLVAIPAVIAIASGHPPINDVTTNPGDPPRFLESTEHGDYPADFVDVAAEAYPAVKPLALSVAASRALAHALDEARDRGWEIVATVDDGFEANERSAIFRFRDDVVVRVRAAGGGSVIDVRSASRDGKGDLGVNAARIESFVAAVARRAR